MPSTPSTAETTKRAASAALSPARTSPTKSGWPGVSTKLTFTPSWTTLATASDTERPSRRSTSSWSQTVVPSSIRPEAGGHAGAQEQGLDQGRLARGRVTDEHHVADPGRVAGRRRLALRRARLRCSPP